MAELTVESMRQLLSEQTASLIKEITAEVEKEVVAQLRPYITRLNQLEADNVILENQIHELKVNLSKRTPPKPQQNN